MAIKHVWFDFSETIGRINKAQHDELKYSEYSKAKGEPVSEELKKDFETQYKLHSNSISDMFYSLGKPAGYWSDRIATIPPSELFELADNNIPDILQRIKKHVPISVFSNINLDEVLPALHIDTRMFEHILSGEMVNKPKPAPDGFYKMVELSGLPPMQILYIGDHVEKDIIPAKEVGIQAGLIWGESNEADYNFNSFEEILDLVEN